MKYYAIADVYSDGLRLREYQHTTMTGKGDFWYHAVYDDELKALRECNDLNQEMDAEYKCVN